MTPVELVAATIPSLILASSGRGTRQETDDRKGVDMSYQVQGTWTPTVGQAFRVMLCAICRIEMKMDQTAEKVISTTHDNLIEKDRCLLKALSEESREVCGRVLDRATQIGDKT
jgi:hypothetical protein